MPKMYLTLDATIATVAHMNTHRNCLLRKEKGYYKFTKSQEKRNGLMDDINIFNKNKMD